MRISSQTCSNAGCIDDREKWRGDTIAMQGEVTHVHDDGTLTVRLHGFAYPVTTTGEHLSLVAKCKAEPGLRKKLFDEPD